MNTPQRIRKYLKDANDRAVRSRTHAELSQTRRETADMRRWRDYAAGGHGSTHREPEVRGRSR